MTSARWARGLCVTALMVATYFLLPVDPQPRGGLPLRIGISAAAFALTTAVLLAQVRLAVARPDRRLDGLLAAIALAWVMFSLAFYVIERHHPGEVGGLHTRLDALYFTASTILTVGYGDIHATGQAARALVLVQMLFDIVFIAGAAGLVSSRLRDRAAARASRVDERPRHGAPPMPQGRLTHRKPR